jgi:hypothetical protein
MSVQEVVNYLTNDCSELSFTQFASNHISNMFSNDRTGSALSYRMAVKRLHEYMGKSNILFSDITANVLRGWIDSMMDSSRKRNLYPICIKAMFGAAMLRYNDEDREIIRIKRNPFSKITIPKAKQPGKRSVEIETIRTFFCLEIPVLHMREEMSRDVCMMMFCLAGINTADLYDLPADAIKDGVLCCRRKKTRDKSLTGSYSEIRIPERIPPAVREIQRSKTASLLL